MMPNTNWGLPHHLWFLAHSHLEFTTDVFG